MTRDETIDNMAKLMCDQCGSTGCIEEHPCDGVIEQAVALYEAGYRLVVDDAEANKPNYQQKIIELLEDVEETLTRKKWEYEAMARGVLECIKEINQEIEEQKLNERSIKQ